MRFALTIVGVILFGWLCFAAGQHSAVSTRTSTPAVASDSFPDPTPDVTAANQHALDSLAASRR